jgi:hypothetical protein
VSVWLGEGVPEGAVLEEGDVVWVGCVFDEDVWLEGED